MDNNNDICDDRWVADRLAALRPEGAWEPDAARALTRFRAQRELKSKRVRRWGWVAAGAVAAALPIAAFPSTREFAHRCVSACVSQSNWALTLFTANARTSSVYVKAADRTIAPDFALNDASGKLVKLSDFRGKVVLLNFWATWCAPCSLEIPWFVEFQRELGSRGLATLGVSLDENGWNAVRPYVDARKISYPVMLGNDDVAQLYSANSLPTTLIIDRYGRIAATHIGICSKSEYEADIRAVLEEQ